VRRELLITSDRHARHSLQRRLALLLKEERDSRYFFRPPWSIGHGQIGWSQVHVAVLAWLLPYGVLVLMLLWIRDPVAQGAIGRQEATFGLPVQDVIVAAVWLCVLATVAGLRAVKLALTIRTSVSQRRHITHSRLRKALAALSCVGLGACGGLFALGFWGMWGRLEQLSLVCGEAREALDAAVRQGSSVSQLLHSPSGNSTGVFSDAAHSGAAAGAGVGAGTALMRACETYRMASLVMWMGICGLGVVASAAGLVSGVVFACLPAQQQAILILRSVSRDFFAQVTTSSSLRRASWQAESVAEGRSRRGSSTLRFDARVGRGLRSDLGDEENAVAMVCLREGDAMRELEGRAQGLEEEQQPQDDSGWSAGVEGEVLESAGDGRWRAAGRGGGRQGVPGSAGRRAERGWWGWSRALLMEAAAAVVLVVAVAAVAALSILLAMRDKGSLVYSDMETPLGGEREGSAEESAGPVRLWG
jgi:hypothetical protein